MSSSFYLGSNWNFKLSIQLAEPGDVLLVIWIKLHSEVSNNYSVKCSQGCYVWQAFHHGHAALLLCQLKGVHPLQKLLCLVTLKGMATLIFLSYFWLLKSRILLSLCSINKKNKTRISNIYLNQPAFRYSFIQFKPCSSVSKAFSSKQAISLSTTPNAKFIAVKRKQFRLIIQNDV